MIRTLLSISLAFAFALPVLADDPAAPKKDGDKPAAKAKEGDKPAKKKKEADLTKGPQLRGVVKPIESKVDLTADQKAKVDALVAELQPKYREAMQGVKLTPEQQEARKTAQAKAKADGLKGDKAAKAVQEALKLTAEQKAAMEKQTAIANEFREKFRALLTPEQLASLKKKPANKE
jgi:hypothetical protein